MKSHFKTKLIAEHLDGRWWKLVAPLVYYSETLDDILVAPKGFVTDFASVPRLPILYWAFGTRGNSAATIHDLMYRWGQIPRLKAETVYLEAMKVYGQWFFTRYPMYLGVLLGGHWSYKNLPGCLDYRGCKVKCYNCCDNYIPYWYNTERLMNETMDRSIKSKLMILNNNIVE
jgi:hypothetical protein